MLVSEPETIARRVGRRRAGSSVPSDVNGGRVLPPARPPLRFERGDHVELAARLLDELAEDSDARPLADLGTLHTYDDAAGTWTAVERARASRAVQRFSGALCGGEKPRPLCIRAQDVNGAIRLATDQAEREGFFDAPAAGLAFGDCFVRLEGDRLTTEPHSPGHAARFAYPFKFQETAECPRWLACLAEAFRGDVEVAEKIACLQEFAGASLFGIATRFQRAIVLFGTGDNAKSTVASVIAAAMPRGSACAVPPQSWGSEYRLALMSGKLLNVVSELPEADILDGETFKSMITGDLMTARPIREAPFTFTARAGHLFAANRLPGSNDQSHGFWRRMIVITFQRVFTEAEKTPGLAESILAEELPGIVAWVIAGARRLLAQGRYTIPVSSSATVTAWKRGADPVAQFVEEKTRPPKDYRERETARSLFDAYVAWAEANRFKVMSSHTFGMRLRAIGYGSEHTRTGEVYPVTLLRIGEVAADEDPAEDYDRSV